LGARVFHHLWRGDFASARNVSLSAATGLWILWLDADEALEPDSAAQLKPLLQATTAEGLHVTVRSFYPPDATAEYGDTLQPRLFRNRPEYRFEQRIHEQIAPAIVRRGGRLEPTALRLSHYGYQQATAQNQQDRNQRNLELLQAAVVAEPENNYLRAMLGINLSRVARLEEALPYLQMAVAQPALPAEVLHEAHLALGSIAFARQNFAAAAERAQHSLQYSGPDELTALRLLAQARLAQGEALMREHMQPALAAIETIDLARLSEQIEQARHTYAVAREAFTHLQAHPRLTAHRRAEAEGGLARCAQVQGLLSRLAAVAAR
jgi:tetratricopeptide (TPR) repeat protein